ncbi:MAG: SMC-Scp complex subunit ScpB [Ruminococcus sp.]|nr:SMC-Scp complex subunit ScpB [Ruminococcus sp.]
MQLKDKAAAVEAILFASGEPVDEIRIAEAAEIEKNDVTAIIRILNERYTDNSSALNIIHLGNKYQMCTRKEYAGYIKSAMESKKQAPLSNAAMEVLTVIAYNQPVTKGFVESVRGIDSSSVINTLVDKGLLEEDGRLNVPGRPVAYKTSDNFLRCFGLSSLDDLPPLVRDDEDKQGSLFDEEEVNTDTE